jgi:hypothetical protein
VRYRERLAPPFWWWLLLLLWTASLGIAFGYVLGVGIGIGVFVVGAGLLGWISASVADEVTVGDDGLRVGRAYLSPDAVGAVTSLDAAAARELRGRGGDARAHLLLRGWIPTAVRIDLTDPDDPHPYWYLSTRRPDDLAAALRDIGGQDPAF